MGNSTLTMGASFKKLGAVNRAAVSEPEARKKNSSIEIIHGFGTSLGRRKYGWSA